MDFDWIIDSEECLRIVCWFAYSMIWLLWKQIDIFERGYEKDPAVVAREAIHDAKRKKQDVVLVDTAGRMQVLQFALGSLEC